MYKSNFNLYYQTTCRKKKNLKYLMTYKLSWSVLGHVLSEEQSKDSSNRVSDDGCLTIVQCHHYHRPPSSDLYRSSIGILPPLRYHQNNLHSYHCHYQPTPCAFYRSTTTAPPCSTHVLLRHSFYFYFYFEHLNFT